MSLPPALAAALEARSDGYSRRDLTERLARISLGYRGQQTSAGIRDAADALAYALARMPATFAAISKVLAEVAERAPAWAPHSILDAGAGPGTATWAIKELWPQAEATLLDRNGAFLALAKGLAGEDIRTISGSFGAAAAEPADLVIAGYALTEVPDSDLEPVTAWLWEKTSGVLVLVEPGTPRDYARLLRLRAALIAAGARVLAPCPHERPCPLVPPDWCHFAVRLDRTRDHRTLKSAEASFEDEKFSYFAVARPAIGAPAEGRVIKPAWRNKFEVSLEICAEPGLEARTIPKRDKTAFREARHLEWGDSIRRPEPPSTDLAS